MLAGELLSLVKAYWALILTGVVAGYLLYNKFYKGLNKYPGHPLAAYTNWWRFFDVLGRRAEHTHIALHRKYGDIVRLGPNVLSFADPKAIKVIYGLNKGMTKVHELPSCRVFAVLLTDPTVRLLPCPAGHGERDTSAVTVQHIERGLPCQIPEMCQRSLQHVAAGVLRTTG